MPQPDRLELDELPWLGNGVDLARRMAALADELHHGGNPTAVAAAESIRDVLTCEYNPLDPTAKES